jgi:hypothetical protein
MTRPREFGHGPLSVLSSFVYTTLVIGSQIVAASLPGIIGLFFLARDLGNIPLVAVCALPFGPALSAAVYALHHRRSDPAELRPFRQFWHGYRVNWRAVLPLWTLGLVWLTIIAITLANFWIAGVPVWWAWLLAVIAVLVALWLVNAVVIASLFTFRFRDTVRLAWEMIPRTPVATLGNAGVLAAATVLLLLAGDLALALLSVFFVLMIVGAARPTIDLVKREYTR